MIEVSERTPINIWIEARAIDPDVAEEIGMTFRPGSETSVGPYGRHSALKTMNALAYEDVYVAKPEKIEDFYPIFDALRGY